MKSEELKANMKHAMEEAWNRGNPDRLDDIYTTDFKVHMFSAPDINGIAAYKQYIKELSAALSGIRFQVDDAIVEEGKGAFITSLLGKHTGQSAAMPIPPTGKDIVISGCAIIHFTDGKGTESWWYSDGLSIMQQLGLIPASG
jgi:predicted ester cyclase